MTFELYRPRFHPPGFKPFTEHHCPACGCHRPLDAFYERPDRPLFRRSRWSALCKVHECERIRQKRANGKGAAQRQSQRLLAKSRAAEAARNVNNISYRDGRGHVVATRPDAQARYDAQRAQRIAKASKVREERALMRYFREVRGIRTKSFGDRAYERRMADIREAGLRDLAGSHGDVTMPTDDVYADPVRHAEFLIWADESLTPAKKFARLRALRSSVE